MRFVVARAVRRAVAGLFLLGGALTVLAPPMAKAEWVSYWSGVHDLVRYLVPVVDYRPSQWDTPITLGLLVACLLAATLIYPSRVAPLRRS
jgi:hypothetical protein